MIQLRPSERMQRRLAVLLALAALAYCAWRAHVLSLTHDEALSYMAYAFRPWRELFQWQVIGASANNHLLNSLGMKLGLEQAGAREWALRWLSVAGGAIYCFAALSLARRAGREAGAWWGLGAVVALLAQPYVLDFFSLARGYGPAMGFGLAAVALLLGRVADGGGWWRGAFAMGCAMLAVLASLAFLHLFLALGLALLLAAVLRSKARGLLSWLGAFVPPAALLAMVYTQPVQHLLQSGNLFFGGEEGFVADTVQGLLRCWLYAPAFAKAPLLLPAWGLALAVLAAPLAWWWRSQRGRGLEGLLRRPFFWVTLLLWFLAAGAVSQHLLLGTRFPVERAALALIPLFWLWLVFLALELPRGAGGALLSAIALAAALNFVTNGNLRYSRDWRYDACTREFVLRVAERSRPLFWPARKRTLAVNWLNAPAVAAYLQINNVNWLLWLDLRDADLNKMDYALLQQPSRLQGRDVEILGRCEASGAVLGAFPQSRQRRQEPR